MGTPIEPIDPAQGGNEPAPGPNPAWNDVLSVIPQDLHQQVTPYFQQWDQSAQQRIESVNKQYEPYKPFAESGISSDDLERGLQLMYQLNANPQGVYDALKEAYGFGAQQPQANEPVGQGNQDPAGEQVFQDPRFDSLQQGLDLVAQTILQQNQAAMDKEADAQVDSEIASLKQKYPTISEEFALSLMVNGFDVDAVGKQWEAVSNQILQQNPRPFAPNVMGNSGGGSGLPSQAIDPTKLDGPGRRNLVAQMLAAANREN